ncbi:hypothetical protein BCAR13_820044 [Paraburkholderia caribensis]|nr:hypothetical protein BCAR13_820044 [Paraburkholderia caribensis]
MAPETLKRRIELGLHRYVIQIKGDTTLVSEHECIYERMPYTEGSGSGNERSGMRRSSLRHAACLQQEAPALSGKTQSYFNLPTATAHGKSGQALSNQSYQRWLHKCFAASGLASGKNC